MILETYFIKEWDVLQNYLIYIYSDNFSKTL